MKIYLATAFAALLVAVYSFKPATGNRYYVDAVNGNDANSGSGPSAAWRSIDRANRQQLGPGDRLLFHSGQEFRGTLRVIASGAEGRPLIVSTFGGKKKAWINGGGQSTAISLYNASNILLENLKVSNFKVGKVDSADLFTAIIVVNEDAGTLHNIRFNNLLVCDVNSSHLAIDEGKYDQTRFYGGVQFYTKGNKVRSNFDNVLVENCVFRDLGRTGFNFRSDWDDRSLHSRFGDKLSNGATDNWTPNTRVVFRHNVFRRIAGNGLIVRVAVKPLVEYNLFDSCGTTISGNAVFNFNTDSCIYQYNEARNTVYNPGDVDARGIDSDYRTKHTIIQYNYLHDNELGGVIATGGPGTGEDPLNFNYGTVIRYNVIENNTRQGAYFSGRVEALEVYNNTFYAKPGIDNVEIIKFNRWTVWPSGALFRDNIFSYGGNGLSYSWGSATNIRFDGNVYHYGKAENAPADARAVFADPRFKTVTNGLAGYALKNGSPATGKGYLRMRR